ncbi:hypothetical protein KRR26_15150 [Corallococcus sp. M34]|uniref:hypothetical protein n=1 Tax=Citreicoccus inhibens TaxID=2849499 RepID=UPI001C22FBE8|nr:hypothetical protein [Citreicoccus inhibens]MBU8896955.1 hypothetical protein [Citreicoccus inhibens]
MRVALFLLGGVVLGVGCGPLVQPPLEPDALPPTTTATGTEHHEELTWVRRSVGTPFHDMYGSDVVLDAAGCSILVGTYEGAPDLGGGPLPAVVSENGTNAFIAKYSRDGHLLWARGFGSAPGTLFPETYLEVVVADRHRNLTVRGFSSDPIVLGGHSLQGFFLAQFSSEGAVRWVRQLRGDFDGSPGLVVDSHDDLILAGGVDGPADFGGGPREASPVEGFIVKYSRNGTWRWDRVFDTQDSSTFGGVAVDALDSLYVVGSFDGDADFGGGVLHPVWPGRETAVVARFTPMGAHVWSRTLASMTDLTRFDTVDVVGRRVVMGGRFAGQFQFAGRPFTARPDGASGVVLAMTREGADVWGQTLGTWLWQVRGDATGAVTLLGPAAPGDDVGTGPLPSTASLYLFVSELQTPSGARVWVHTFPGGNLSFTSLAREPAGALVLAGEFNGPVALGTESFVPTTPGFYDALLWRTFERSRRVKLPGQ